MAVNLQKQFFEWLSKKVSQEELSDLYILCKNMEYYYINRNIIKTSLFEIKEIENIQNVLSVTKSKKMRKILIFYIDYLKEIFIPQDDAPKSNNHEDKYIESRTDTSIKNDLKKEDNKKKNHRPIEKKYIEFNSDSEIENSEAYKCDLSDENIEFGTIIPNKIYYFEKEKKVNGWCNAFVQIIKFLLLDYPSIIKGMVGLRLGSKKRAVFSGRNDLMKLKKAIPLINNCFFVESDFSPKEMISILRFIIRKCNIEYNKIGIGYSKTIKEDKNVIQTFCEKVTEEDDHTFRNEREKDFFRWLQVSRAMRNEKSWNMVIMLRKIEEVCRLNELKSDKIVNIGKPDDVLKIISILGRKNSDFDRLNRKYNKQPQIALMRYYEFCKENPLIEINKIDENDNQSIKTNNTNIISGSGFNLKTSLKDVAMYETILKEDFEDGLRLQKVIDKNRFRMFYLERYGKKIEENDEQLIKKLLKIGLVRDGRLYVRNETEQIDLIKDIKETIISTLDGGASCIYLECLFRKFQQPLAEMLHIYNTDSLESILFNSEKQNYFKRYNYIFGYNKEPAPNVDVVEYMKNSYLPVTYQIIEQKLWYIPIDKIKHILVTTPGIVNVASETYLYASNLPINESETNKIINLIKDELLQKSYISDTELMQLIKKHCPAVLVNTADYPTWGLRNALAYLLREKFSFRGAIISAKNEEISMAEVFIDFCRRFERITVDEIKQFASELNTVVYWDSVYNEMIRVNQNEFVRRDQIHFDVEHTDLILDSLIPKTYTPIKTINLFLQFPTIDVPWNSFVLESYVGHYSKKFRLLHASYTATDCCGAIVRQNSGITDYRTLIVDVLANSTGWKNKKDALQLLVDLGYQQRRSYSDIENVMQEATTRRQVTKK